MNENSVAKTPLQWELNRPSFYRELTERFDLNEIKLLCGELDIKYEELDGTTLSTKAVALFDYFERTEKLDDLFKACQKVRPRADWWKFLRQMSPSPVLIPADPNPSKPPQKRDGWLVVGVLLATMALGIGLGWWLWGNGRVTDTNTGEELVTSNITSIPTLANAKEQFGFEADSAESPTIGWSLKTCPNLDTTQCGWLNADDKLSLAQLGFSGENSLQVEAALVNVEQIYSTERCFDPAILDGISANVYVPAREGDGQTLAAAKIYLLARPQGDNNAVHQWPTSVLELDKAAQPGWYQISLDLSQVANESREPFNTLVVDCVHIDFILPATAQNEQATFFIDDVALYRSISSHALITNIPPKGLKADLTDVVTPLGDGLVFNFEDSVIDGTFWTAGDDPLYISRDHAYDGVYSMAIDAHLEEHEGYSGTENACLTLHSKQNILGYSLKNQVIIKRIYVPNDVPDNLQVQFHTIDSGFWPTYGNITPGQWNTLVWYTADAPEMEQDTNLEVCLILRDRDAENDLKNSYDGTFYIDGVEIIPYKFVHIGKDQDILEPIEFYAFVSDDPPSIIATGTNPVTITSGITLTIGDSEIYALQLDVDLSPNPTNNRTIGSVVTMQLDPDEKPIEAVISMINFPSDPGVTLLVTIEGTLSNGNVISQKFPVSARNWTPLFWPTRGNDFDAGGSTREMVELAIYLTSPDGYQGPVYFDYLALYRRFPEQ